MTSSPSGPCFFADEERMGQGCHWDIHGPWIVEGDLAEEWTHYWHNDDALFRSEAGVPGASSASVIQEFSGTLPLLPVNWENSLWRRTGWWIEYPRFVEEHGRDFSPGSALF